MDTSIPGPYVYTDSLKQSFDEVYAISLSCLLESFFFFFFYTG